MKKLNYLLIILGIILMTSCNVRVDNNVKTSRFEDKVHYFQCKKTGAVFAVVTIKSGVNMAEDGVGIAHISNADVTPAIKKEIKNFDEKLFKQ